MRHEHDGLGAPDHVPDALLAPAAELLVARAQDLVEQQDVRRDRGRDGEPEARPHARGVRPHRRVDERPEVGELDDRRGQAPHDAVADPDEGADQEDVLPPGDLHLEPGAQREQGRDAPAQRDGSLVRGQDPGQRKQERALAGTVLAQDPQRLAVLDLEVDVAERPEVAAHLLLAADPLRQRPLERGSPGQVEVVADPEVADLDRVGRGWHQRIFANPVSIRLKTQIEIVSRTSESSSTTASAPQSGAMP